MKIENKPQIVSNELQQDMMLNADQSQHIENLLSSAFKTASGDKKVLSAGMQKKSNPRLFIL
ncbi:hypothetical protein ACSBL2_12930 [Pedobacter sp. AW31-3R]|uniref:hypothetical protein n=1 Tax=Pedobacter sp. AW31-3R TaxID=3445781 RepID=UPI003FA14052